MPCSTCIIHLCPQWEPQESVQVVVILELQYIALARPSVTMTHHGSQAHGKEAATDVI